MPSQKVQHRAVGLFGSTGVLARGVADAGFQIVSQLAEGTSGAATHAHNFPRTPCYTKPGEWPIDVLSDEGLDLVYAQPQAHQCFVAGTIVPTSRGPLPIEQVRRGDSVMSYRNDRYQPVTGVMRRNYGGPLVQVSTDLGELFTCTPEHPLCTAYSGEPDGWTQAKDCGGLRVWQSIAMAFSPPLTVKVVPPSGEVVVYNLEVGTDHCYVAGGLAVHNCDMAVATGLALKPRAFMMEAGSDAFSDPARIGRWEKRWSAAGFRTVRMLTDSAALGLPQVRRRTVFFAAKAAMAFSVDHALPRATSVWEAIGDLMTQPLADDPQAECAYTSEPQSDYQGYCRQKVRRGVTWHVRSPGAPSLESLIPHIPPGQHIGKVPDEVYEQTYWKERTKFVTPGGKGKPSYFYRRLHWDRPSPSIPGDIRFVHPEFDRYLTPRESARLMGVPDDFGFAGSSAARANMEAGRAWSPYVARALLVQLLRFLRQPNGEHRPVVSLLSERKSLVAA